MWRLGPFFFRFRVEGCPGVGGLGFRVRGLGFFSGLRGLGIGGFGFFGGSGILSKGSTG